MNVDFVMSKLALYEGETLHAYDDHLGFLTIGVGRLIDRRKGGGITREESRYLLRNDVDKCIRQCQERFHWFTGLNEARQHVIVCMAFQLGIDGLAGFVKMAKAIETGDFVSASREMLDSKWHTETPGRCEAMAAIMKAGVWK